MFWSLSCQYWPAGVLCIRRQQWTTAPCWCCCSAQSTAWWERPDQLSCSAKQKQHRKVFNPKPGPTLNTLVCLSTLFPISPFTNSQLFTPTEQLPLLPQIILITVTSERCCSTTRLRGSRICQEVKTNTSSRNIQSTTLPVLHRRLCCCKHRHTTRQFSDGGNQTVKSDLVVVIHLVFDTAEWVDSPCLGEQHSEAHSVTHRQSPQTNLSEQTNPTWLNVWNTNSREGGFPLMKHVRHVEDVN